MSDQNNTSSEVISDEWRLAPAVPNKILNDDGTYSTWQEVIGGGQSNLQEKSVTITENGETTVEPDTGYNGLSSVNITTNIEGEQNIIFDIDSNTNSKYMSAFLTKIIIDIKSENKKVLLRDDSSGTNYKALKEVALLNNENLKDANQMFYRNGFETLSEFRTDSVTNMNECFQYCSNLKNIPVFNLKSITTYIARAFEGCNSLTNASLQNILKSLLTLENYSGTKTLAFIGLTSEQATTCISFPEWTTLSANGWTTGY